VAETIGSLVDKISIVELKRFAMQKQLERTDASAEHVKKCGERLKILTEQRDDLVLEVSELTDAVLSGKKKLKVYRQFKMYNDPAYRVNATSR
jgi:hypothetical protein